MDLVIEGKDLKMNLDKEAKKNEEMRNGLREEVSLIKDDLQA
jgi:hypothetical protein